MGRARFFYSTRSGESVYNIAPGHIIKLTDLQLKRNWKAGKRMRHEVYIWILRVHRSLKPGERQRDRKVNIFVFKMPTEKHYRWQYLSWQRTVTIGYLQKLLAEGYKTISKRCVWNYKADEGRKFYRAIGLIK